MALNEALLTEGQLRHYPRKIEIDYERQIITFDGVPFSMELFAAHTKPTPRGIFYRFDIEQGTCIIHQFNVDDDLFDLMVARRGK